MAFQRIKFTVVIITNTPIIKYRKKELWNKGGGSLQLALTFFHIIVHYDYSVLSSTVSTLKYA